MKTAIRWYWCFLLVVASILRLHAAEAKPVYVLFWFDTEDYLLPADDDATKRLCEMFTARNVHATFKLVGEKARVLEKRGRTDVIEALKKHDIGYHANFHSVHPTPAEYLAKCDLLDGIGEFVRREGGGAADVRRIFARDTLVCYGQPGASWAAQAIAALPQIGVAPSGVPCYVDDGSHVGLNAQPFWYAGAVVVYDMGPNVTRMDLHNPAAVQPGKEKFTQIANRLRENGGGLISIYYHPCEWVHREFWDGVNFARGANPPREQWKAPPQRTPEETEGAFVRFAEYLDHVVASPGIKLVTATNLPTLYADPVRQSGASESDLQAVVQRLSGAGKSGIDYLSVRGKVLSVADQFELLAAALVERIEGRAPTFPHPIPSLLGPDHEAFATEMNSVPWSDFREAVRDAQNYLKANGRVPARVFIGAEAIPPLDFLTGMAFALNEQRKNGSLPARILLQPGLELLPARHVAKDTPDLFGGWVIHPTGFRAPKILEVARLQAWTLKPAVLAGE
jgi:hypothetical protein